MTRRERLEHKLEKRQEWADKAAARSTEAYNRAGSVAHSIPFGQPILVGHHSEARARADIKRIDNGMRKSIEQTRLAEHHEQKVAGLSYQLEHNIFSDDPDAEEAIQARIDANEAKRAQMKKVNALYRKGDADGLKVLGIDLEALKAELTAAGNYWGKAPHMAFDLTNLGARIVADKKRLVAIRRQRQVRAAAEQAPNGVTLVDHKNDFASVTFAEKPDYAVIKDLKAAGYRWGGGQWSGYLAKLPESVKVLLQV